MGIIRQKKFSLAEDAVEPINIPGATRIDIEVSGTVNIVNGQGDTVDTLTDTSGNYYWSFAFSLVASGGAASGRYAGVTNSTR